MYGPIAIGCSLLVLNVLIFTAVYYQRDRNRERNSSKLDTSILTCNSLSDGGHSSHGGFLICESGDKCTYSWTTNREWTAK